MRNNATGNSEYKNSLPLFDFNVLNILRLVISSAFQRDGKLRSNEDYKQTTKTCKELYVALKTIKPAKAGLKS